jgi:hypothetical protein
MAECGPIFNRHKWKYLDSRHRICTKCGECNEAFFSPLADYWFETDFDSLMKQVNDNKIKTDKFAESKRKALDAVREH